MRRTAGSSLMAMTSAVRSGCLGNWGSFHMLTNDDDPPHAPSASAKTTGAAMRFCVRMQEFIGTTPSRLGYL
jgi:hypothetical protein